MDRRTDGLGLFEVRSRGRVAGAPLQPLLLRRHPPPLGSPPDVHPPLPLGLHVRLIIAPYAISYHNKGEIRFVEFVSQVQSVGYGPVGKESVILALLDGIVQGGVTEVFGSVGDEEGLKLSRGMDGWVGYKETKAQWCQRVRRNREEPSQSAPRLFHLTPTPAHPPLLTSGYLFQENFFFNMVLLPEETSSGFSVGIIIDVPILGRSGRCLGG